MSTLASIRQRTTRHIDLAVEPWVRPDEIDPSTVDAETLSAFRAWAGAVLRHRVNGGDDPGEPPRRRCHRRRTGFVAAAG